MKWLDKLERKYHRYAIPNLIQYIVGGMALVFVFTLLNRQMTSALLFSPAAVLRGEVWRLLTFLIMPLNGSPFWILFSLLFTFFVGRSLEAYWGTFKFNVYYFIGVLGTMVMAILLTLVTGFDFAMSNTHIHTSMFLALCTIAPEYEIRVYMILPVKLKWLGWITAAGLGLSILTALISGNWAMAVAILIAFANYLLFFGPGLINRQKQSYRRNQFKQAQRQPHKVQRKAPKSRAKEGQVIQVAFHCCEVCGKTEVDDPTLEFRYCSKCGGRHEYCSEHILNHEHKKV